MNVRELIEQLSSMPPEAEVHFMYDYGDRSHTSVAPKVTDVAEMTVKPSDYHRMPVVVDLDDDDIEGPDRKEVVVLS